jgi:membrane protein DedA with SNARE-associated domain
MPEHLAIIRALAFVEKHGYALLFLWVLAEQSGLPLPSVPLLLAAGALIRAGRLDALIAILCCVSAALIADTVWFQLGRRRGRRVLRLLCRVSLEPDSCVRQTENAFLRYGMKSLLVSKFIPGLNAVSAPLAGNSKATYWRFVLYDAVGATIWIVAYLSLGYLFSEQLDITLAYASRLGSSLLLLLPALVALWIGWKLIQRRRFLRLLDGARITPEDLWDRLNAGEEPFIIDVRGRLSERLNPIPGSSWIPLEELAARSQEVPRDRDIILFCT